MAMRAASPLTYACPVAKASPGAYRSTVTTRTGALPGRRVRLIVATALVASSCTGVLGLDGDYVAIPADGAGGGSGGGPSGDGASDASGQTGGGASTGGAVASTGGAGAGGTNTGGTGGDVGTGGVGAGGVGTGGDVATGGDVGTGGIGTGGDVATGGVAATGGSGPTCNASSCPSCTITGVLGQPCCTSSDQCGCRPILGVLPCQ